MVSLKQTFRGKFGERITMSSGGSLADLARMIVESFQRLTPEHQAQLRKELYEQVTGRRFARTSGVLLFEVPENGPAICVVQGDDGHLCWGTGQTNLAELQINNIALAETTYLFCDWALRLYQHAEPPPVRTRIRAMFADMNQSGNSFALNNYHLTRHNFGFRGHPAPYPAGQHFEVETEWQTNPKSSQSLMRR